MKKISILFILTISFLSQEISYSQVKGRVVTLNEFVKSYLEHSYTLKTKYEDLRNARGQKLLVESVDELSLTSDMGYNYGKDYLNGTETLPGNANFFSGKVGVQKQFSASGTVIQLSDSFGTGKAIGNNGSGNNVTISVVQPVLQNFFGFMSRIPIARAALSVKAAELDYQKSIEVEISQAVNIYLQWISSYKESQMLTDIISNNQVVFNQTRAQLRAGISEVSDLEISRVAVIQYQQQLLGNKASYASIIYSLNDYLPVSINDKPDINVVTNFLSIPNIEINPNYIKSIRSLNYLLDSGQMSVDYARNMYLPNLDIVASYGQNSGEKQFLGQNAGSGSFKQNFYLGFQFSVPLFFMQARGQEIQAISQYQQILLQRDQAVRDIIRSSKDLQNQLNLMNEQLQQQKTLIEALKRQVASQTRQFRRGTLDLENLINGRNNLSNSMLNQNKLQIQASQLYNQYLELIDQLQEQYKDSLPDNLILE